MKKANEESQLGNLQKDNIYPYYINDTTFAKQLIYARKQTRHGDRDRVKHTTGSETTTKLKN